MAATQKRASAFRFIIAIGVVSLFADMTYEGARSVVGPFLKDLGASATQVGIITRLGERDWTSVLHCARSSSPIDYVLEFGHFIWRELESCVDRFDYHYRGIRSGPALRKATQRADDRRRRSHLSWSQRQSIEVDRSLDQCSDRGGRHGVHRRD